MWGSRFLAVVALGAVLPVMASFALPDGRRASQQPSVDAPDGPSRRAGGDEAPPPGPADGRRGGMRRELTDKDVERIIATARDVDPAWADGLDALQREDPAKLRQRLRSQARMLMGLSMLRERQPELYEARVQDFRVQRQIRGAIDRLQKAREAGDAAAQEAARAEAREAIERQFELEVKARAYELVAMERALKDARKRLQTDIQARESRLAEAIEGAERGVMPRFGRGPDGEGPWMWRERDGGRPEGDPPGGGRPESPAAAPLP